MYRQNAGPLLQAKTMARRARVCGGWCTYVAVCFVLLPEKGCHAVGIMSLVVGTAAVW